MAIDDITQKISDRYARAAATGEQMCCPCLHCVQTGGSATTIGHG